MDYGIKPMLDTQQYMMLFVDREALLLRRGDG
jgi:hypothetical protein